MPEEWFNQYAWIIIAIAVWELVWKGWAMWRAAQNNDKAWYIILLLVNSLGLLPIFYIFVFSKRSRKHEIET